MVMHGLCCTGAARCAGQWPVDSSSRCTHTVYCTCADWSIAHARGRSNAHARGQSHAHARGRSNAHARAMLFHAHLHSSCLHGVTELHGQVYVGGEHASLEGKVAVIAMLHRSMHIFHAHDWQHRPKLLLPGKLHVSRDIVHEHRVDEVPFPLPLGQKCCPFVLCICTAPFQFFAPSILHNIRMTSQQLSKRAERCSCLHGSAPATVY
jgi:hypothetical protein